MRRLAVALLTVAAAVAPAASAHAADRGTIAGRVMHGTTKRPVAGVEVTLTTNAEGKGAERTVRTDERGAYAFEDLKTGDDIFYALDATYKGGLFAGRPLSIPSDTAEEPLIRTTLRVFEPTTDPNAILIRGDRLVVVQDEDRVSVIEAVKVVNPTNNAYIGRGSALGSGDGDDATPSLGFALPDAALPETVAFIDADLDVPQLVEVAGFGFGITTAIPPGEVDFTFSYQVEGSGGNFDLSRTALYEISELSVLAAEPLEIRSNRLTAAEPDQIEGRTYAISSSTDALDPADPIQILVVAQGAASVPLIAGAAAGLMLLSIIAFVAFRRGRRGETLPPPVDDSGSTDDHEDLVAAIARLDLRREGGDIELEEYARKRAELKARLGEVGTSEPAARR